MAADAAANTVHIPAVIFDFLISVSLDAIKNLLLQVHFQFFILIIHVFSLTANRIT